MKTECIVRRAPVGVCVRRSASLNLLMCCSLFDENIKRNKKRLKILSQAGIAMQSCKVATGGVDVSNSWKLTLEWHRLSRSCLFWWRRVLVKTMSRATCCRHCLWREKKYREIVWLNSCPSRKSWMTSQSSTLEHCFQTHPDCNNSIRQLDSTHK